MKVKEFRDFIFKSRDKELNKKLNKLFGENLSVNELMNNLDTLRKLDDKTLIYGIARMDRIETEFDHSKYLPALITLVAAMFLIYQKTLNIGIVFILATALLVTLTIQIMAERKKRVAAVFFRCLLVQVKEFKKKESIN